MNYKAEIEAFFKDSYIEDSLAYLSLTTKVEHPFRDQFAFYLHKKYPEAIVSREYSDDFFKRVDLAIISTHKHKEYVEFKACYAFDLKLDKNMSTKNAILRDFDKYKSEASNNVTSIKLSIRTNKYPEKGNEYIPKKYLKGMESVFNEYPDTEKQREFSIINMTTWFPPNKGGRELKEYGTVRLGCSVGVEVFLDYFIIQ
jgi:hypothetical protein